MDGVVDFQVGVVVPVAGRGGDGAVRDALGVVIRVPVVGVIALSVRACESEGVDASFAARAGSGRVGGSGGSGSGRALEVRVRRLRLK